MTIIKREQVQDCLTRALGGAGATITVTPAPGTQTPPDDETTVTTAEAVADNLIAWLEAEG